MFFEILIFFIILLLLVLSHEAGHFFLARRFGVKVEEFGFGLPPRILSLWRDKQGTLYSVNILPLGGFVKIFGEEGSEADDPRSFGAKPALERALILAGGAFANVLLAYFLLSAASYLGVPQAISEEEKYLYPDSGITIIGVAPGSPAFSARIAAGDRVQKLKSENGEFSPQTIADVQNFINENRGKNILLFLLRGETFLEISVLPRENPPEGEGPLGIALELVGTRKSAWYSAPIDGAVFTWQALRATLSGFWELLKNIFQKQELGVEVSGPVGIFNITSSAASLGFGSLLLLAAVLSINLSIINILPFPGLDGGRLFFVFLEAVRGKRISPKTSALAHSLGLIILIALMLAVTYRDIAKIY